MKKKIQLISSLLLLLFLVWFFNRNTADDSDRTESSATRPTSTTANSANFIYTKHARCRMDCRHVSEAEVLQIISAGTINHKKSGAHDKPCPTVAYEGRSDDNQLLRIIVADCEPKDKIVTVIDLETDYKCDCY